MTSNYHTYHSLHLKPPNYVLAFNKAVYPNFTGYWMGWRWVNGKPVGRAPAVGR
jgi:hypothetical protein